MVRRDASISIELDAQTARLERKIEDATADIEGLNSSLLNLDAALDIAGRLWDAFAAAAEIAADALRLVNDELQRLSELQADALRTGVSTAALDQLSRAARIAGVDVDQVRESVFELNKRLGEARAEGAGTAFEAFERLGLDINLDRSNEELFDEFVSRLQTTRAGNQQLADFIADDLLGDVGRDLIPLIEQYDQVIQKAGENTLVTNEQLNEYAAASAVYAQDLAGLTILWNDLTTILAGELAPTLIVGVRILREMVLVVADLTVVVARFIEENAERINLLRRAFLPGNLNFAIDAISATGIQDQFRAIYNEVLKDIEAQRALTGGGPAAAGAPGITPNVSLPALRIATRERGAFARQQELERRQQELEIQRRLLNAAERTADNTEQLPEAVDL